MKVMLLTAPGHTPYMPPLALETLAACLRADGREVRCLDVSIDFLHYLLSPERLKKYSSRSYRLFVFAAMTLYRGRHREWKHKVLQANRDPAGLFSRIGKLRTGDGFRLTPAEFSAQIDAVNMALLYTTLPFFPDLVTLNLFTARLRLLSPFVPYYRKVLVPKIREYAPDLVGVSVSLDSQRTSAAQMLAVLSRALPGVPLVAGGSWVSCFCLNNFGPPPGSASSASGAGKILMPYLKPYAVQGEGEEPLRGLCEVLEKGDSPCDVPGLITHDGEKGRILFNGKNPPLEARHSGELTFRDFPVGRAYLSPFTILPMMTSRGCYWNRCTYCDFTASLEGKWREVQPERVLRTIERLKAEHGADFIYFSDNCMSPRMFRKISGHLRDADPKTGFFTMIRFEKALLPLLDDASRDGSTVLAFGMESGCGRILSLMRKGHDTALAEAVVEACARNGVLPLLFLMAGFPGETAEDARETADFLRKHYDRISGFIVFPWYLAPRSVIGKNPAKFGVSFPGGGDWTGPRTDYTVQEGLSHREAVRFRDTLEKDPLLSGKALVADRFLGIDYYIIRRVLDRERPSPLS